MGPGVLIAVLSSALGGTAAVATRYLVQDADALAVAFLRYLIAAVTMALFVGRTAWSVIPYRDIARIMVLGAVMFGLFPWSYSISLSLTTSAVGTIAFCVLPVFTLAIAAMIGAESVGWMRAGGIAVAVMGVAVALADRLAAPSTAVGVLYMFGASFCGAVFSVYSRPYFQKYRPVWVMAIAMIGGVAALATPVTVSGAIRSLSNLSGTGCLVAAYVGVLGSALCYLLWGEALRLTSSTNVAVTITVAPIAAMALGWLVLDEQVGLWMLPGTALVAIGVYRVNRPNVARASRHAGVS